jgi:hypothetical protein
MGNNRFSSIVVRTLTVLNSFTSVAGFIGDLTGNVTGNVVGNVAGNVTGNTTGNSTGLHYDAAAPTAYSGATGAANKAIDPAIAVASLTKATAGTDYTLAAPGAANVNKTIEVYSTTAAAHVVTVTGCLGGTTLTFAAAIGAGFTLYAISATAWAVRSLNGITQTT